MISVKAAFKGRKRAFPGDRKGTVLVIVMSFIALMVMSTVALSGLIKRDVDLVERVRSREQARLLAEAGIKHALGTMKASGFPALSDFNNRLDTGSYRVTVTRTGDRYLITSRGFVSNVSATASVEVADNTPTALYCFSGAGNIVRINSFVADAGIVGDIHANRDVYLMAGPLIAWLTIKGDVSASGRVVEGTLHDEGSWDFFDDRVSINGMANDTAKVYEGEDRITFPTFNFSEYRAAAEGSGDYYPGDTVFDSEALTPDNGIVYVGGTAFFEGPCSVAGGIVAEEIRIRGALSQTKSGTRNVILTTEGDIGVLGRLSVQEALVMSAQDIVSLQLYAELDVKGIMLARRNIDIWNFLTLIDYDYVSVHPEDMEGEDGREVFELVSWNR